MKILLLVTSLTTFTFQSQGQENKSKIDKKDLKRFVQILASDSAEGRGTGTGGQKRVEKFIANRFRNLGLNFYHKDGYLEKFKLTQTYWGEVYMKSQTTTLKNF